MDEMTFEIGLKQYSENQKVKIWWWEQELCKYVESETFLRGKNNEEKPQQKTCSIYSEMNISD